MLDSKNLPFKILSIDGGGIKGLYSALVLAHLEEKYRCRLVDRFDMICGTSTGGLIALGLSIGIPARELAVFYEKQGPKIFKSWPGRGFIGAIEQTLFGGKYNNWNLHKAIVDVLGKDTKMSDAEALLCIPSFNLMKGIPRVFKYPHPEGNNRVDKYGKMVDVALATTAAPTYFPVASIDDSYYVDGGVWANNPTLCGLMEALEYFVGSDKQLYGYNQYKKFTRYAILSVGSVQERNAWSTKGPFGFKKHRKRSFVFGWRDKLFQTTLDAQSHFADNMTRKLITNTKVPGDYHRIESPPLSPEQHEIIGLDNASPAAIRQLKILGNQVGDDYCTSKNKFINGFFYHPKQFILK